MEDDRVMVEAKDLNMIYKKPVVSNGGMGLLRDIIWRKYDYYEALKDVSFQVQRGEILGYLGPNGAGKSTTIKILTGVMHPTSGQVMVNGISPHQNRKENAKSIALISGQRSNLYWDLPVYESFELHKRIYKISEKRYKENMEMFQTLLPMDRFINTPVRQLSLGQRIMADFALAFLHDPSIVYLDEPTIGLDVNAKENIIDFLLHINQTRKVTMIVTSHDLSDIDKLCEKILIIDRGRMIYEGGKDELIKAYCKEMCTIIMELENPSESLNDIRLASCELEQSGNQLKISFSRQNKNPTSVIADVMNLGCTIKDFTVMETSLEDAIKIIYKCD